MFLRRLLDVVAFHLEKSSDVIKSVVELIDVEGQRHIIEEVQKEKYLSDVIQSDGKNVLNIQERKNRGCISDQTSVWVITTSRLQTSSGTLYFFQPCYQTQRPGTIVQRKKYPSWKV